MNNYLNFALLLIFVTFSPTMAVAQNANVDGSAPTVFDFRPAPSHQEALNEQAAKSGKEQPSSAFGTAVQGITSAGRVEDGRKMLKYWSNIEPKKRAAAFGWSEDAVKSLASATKNAKKRCLVIISDDDWAKLKKMSDEALSSKIHAHR